jgi:hypothetical protein
MTTVRWPVRITASAGTSNTSLRSLDVKLIVANIPGTNWPAGFASSIRAFIVLVCALISGNSRATRPLNDLPGSASVVASTGAPGSDERGEAFGDVGIDPDRSETIEPEQRRTRASPSFPRAPSAR